MEYFPGQYENEEVIRVVRKHPIVYVRITAVFLLIVMLPVALFVIFWLRRYGFDDKGTLFLLLGACFYLLYGMLFLCVRWMEESFDLFIITSMRLIDFTQINMFKRHISSTPLEHVQDTEGKIGGLIATMLNYGDLTVRTAAATTSTFFLDHIGNPERVAHDLLAMAHKKAAEAAKAAAAPSEAEAILEGVTGNKPT